MEITKAKVLVTGGAGFIGSHLLDALMKKTSDITVIDNLSKGTKKYLKNYERKKDFKFIEGDIRNQDILDEAIKDREIIFHFAAQPDVRLSLTQIAEDFEINVTATVQILELMKKYKIRSIVFASSAGTIYGEAATLPTPETYPLSPISHYGASKAACEMYLQSYTNLHNFLVTSLRYGNIFGPRSAHGVMYDFFQKLKKNPNQLEILGDGKQEKSYLYINDCIEATILATESTKDGFEAYNISSDETIIVDEIARIMLNELGLKNIKISYTGGKRGWAGDVVKCFANTSKIRNLGWKPNNTTEDGIRKYTNWLEQTTDQRPQT